MCRLTTVSRSESSPADSAGAGSGPGFYVPLSAVLAEGDRRSLYLVGTGMRLEKVAVTFVGDPVGALQRVRDSGAGRLRGGAQVILDGIHSFGYAPDERVRIMESVEVGS